MYPTWYNCLQGGWTWQDFGDCNKIPQCFGRAQICHFCVKNVVFMIAWKHSWHWWEVVEEVSLKHKHYSRVRYPLLGRGREQLLQFSLKAQQKQADLNWKLHKSSMTCVESLTLGLQKVRNCDKTVYWGCPLSKQTLRSRGPTTSGSLPVCATGPIWLTLLHLKRKIKTDS